VVESHLGEATLSAQPSQEGKDNTCAYRSFKLTLKSGEAEALFRMPGVNSGGGARAPAALL
jgi:hypothetical protein